MGWGWWWWWWKGEEEGGEEGKGGLTRLELYSIHMEFLAGLVMSCPATVGTMSVGGMCRRPGPRRRGFSGCEGISEGSIVSPGRTIGLPVAMVGGWLCLGCLSWEVLRVRGGDVLV